MVNYNDIAKNSGVSPTTVSHVINKTRVVLPETKKKVVDAMKELKYTPNLLARSLATGKTNTIGLLISDIKNPFYPELIQGVEEVAVNNGYNIFLCNTDYDVKKGLRSIDALISRKTDGIILASSQIEKQTIEKIKDTGTNLVLAGWSDDMIDVDVLYADYDKGFKEAVDHLFSLGRSRIFFISGPSNIKTANMRVQSFKNAISKYKDITYKVFEGDHKIKGGLKAASEILKEKELPDAVICSNDLSAIGALNAFVAAGKSVPGDISIIGFDNIEMTRIITPKLTTIGLERYEMGKSAMEFMLKRISNKSRPIQVKAFNTKLIIRESTSVI